MAKSFFEALCGLPHCFCSAFTASALPSALWSLLQIFNPLANPAPLLTEMMLLCYLAALSVTYFPLASEILG